MTVAHDNVEMEKLRSRVVEVEARNAALEAQVAHLTKQLFARKSERQAEDNHPTLPFPGDEPELPPPPHVDEAADDEYEEITYTRKKRGATRISKDLPRENSAR